MTYPVMLLPRAIWIAENEDRLTTTQRSLVSAGLYKGQLMVDIAGQARRIEDAREIKLGWVDTFKRIWDTSQQIRVELIYDGEASSISVDELKEDLMAAFSTRPRVSKGWNPGLITFDQFSEAMRTCDTFELVFELVRKYTTVRPELR